MVKVLFVCLGNICRSPAAEGVMKKLVKDSGLDDEILVDSAGTGGWHIGELPDERMRKHALKRNITLDSKARQFDSEKDFQNFDYIIGMDDSNMKNILSFEISKNCKDKIFKMTDFKQRLQWDTVPDPYYGGEDGFEQVLDIVEDASRGLLKHIRR